MRRDVFISYAHKDQAVQARELAAWLENKRLSCWLDHDELRAGSEYDKQILYAIRGCRVMLALVSTGSIRSKYVPFEVSAAAGIQKLVVLAIMEDLPLETLDRPFNAKASGIQFRKLYSTTDLDGEKERLARDLQEHCTTHRNRQRLRGLGIAGLIIAAMLTGWVLRPMASLL